MDAMDILKEGGRIDYKFTICVKHTSENVPIEVSVSSMSILAMCRMIERAKKDGLSQVVIPESQFNEFLCDVDLWKNLIFEYGSIAMKSIKKEGDDT